MNQLNGVAARKVLPFLRESSASLKLVFPGHKNFARHECLQTLEIEPTNDFAVYEFLLPADADLQTIGMELPMLPGIVRLGEIDIFSRTNHVFPYWRCSAGTEFRGMLEPVSVERRVLDGALVMIPAQNQRQITICPDVLPEGDRIVRISLAFETELSSSLLSSLSRHFDKSTTAAVRNAAARQAEAQELLEMIRLKDRQLAERVNLRPTYEANLLRALRYLRRHVVASLRYVKRRLPRRLQAILSR
ncbi:MAG: hypothetical protein K8U03_14780 [Planctomycetia bacterium]|nr:hypothetical protein [Planctomycetia bacterium]